MKSEAPSSSDMMGVYKMLPEGTLAELISGKLYMSPTPSPRHQRSVKKLMLALHHVIDENDLGELFMAPCDVYLDDEANAVQPDLFFISRDKIEVMDDSPIRGVPDLIVEVLSPGNGNYDLFIKKDLYERFGVAEYWIVNPKTREAIVHSLRGGTYVIADKGIRKFYSPLLDRDFEL